MKANTLIKNLLKEQGITESKLARAMNTSKQNIHNKLSTNGTNSSINLNGLIDMANYLDYDVVLVPKSRSEKAGIIITKED